MNYLQQLLNASRLLSVLWENLPGEMTTSALYSRIAGYLERYAAYTSIDPDQAIEIYVNFITAYNKHCKQFIKTGKYPSEAEGNNFQIERQGYDIILLMSVLFTPHRFRIMEYLQQDAGTGKALFIGLGPGLEMDLTKEKYSEVHAYDLSISDFLFSEFPGVSLNRALYAGQKRDYFDAVYLIELLEHIPDPLQLVKTCGESLKKGGHIFLTTATDIPQFDHLYNFTLDHTGFEEHLKSMGFAILYKEVISHHYLTLPIKPYNHLYKIEKI